jgi:NADPH-dependent curcumin reductase CurA
LIGSRSIGELSDMPDDATARPTTAREIRLASRPAGEPHEPTIANFDLVEADVPAPGPGQVLVRNTWMSVDPYMRGRMDDAESYIPPFALGAPLEGSAIGEVVESRADNVPAGATVSHFLGWRDYAVVDASDVTVVDVTNVPAQAYLGVLGIPGLTAYAALTEVAPVRPGDVVFVSSAAGAIGSVAGQLARKLGASRVVGSTGGPHKTRKLIEVFGFDAAIDYKAGPVGKQLTSAAPDGIDVYLDAVGGDHLEAAIDALHVGGRVALVGAIGQWNTTTPPPGPTNLFQAVAKELSLRGMLVDSHLTRMPEYVETATKWLTEGSLQTEETILEGLDQAPRGLIEVLRGGNVGKMLVRLG